MENGVQYDPLEAPEPEEWLAIDEAERIQLAQDYHRHARVRLPNEKLHAVFHVIVENQIALGDEIKIFIARGFSLNASLKPGAQYGQSDVSLAVVEPQKYVVRLFVDNEGVPSTGRNEAGVSFQDNALLGRGDSLNFYATHSSGANNGSLSYRIPVTQRGGAIALAYSNNTTAINAGPLEALDVTAKSSTYLVSYTQPWSGHRAGTGRRAVTGPWWRTASRHVRRRNSRR
jgi:hypothetical protein